MTTTNIILLVQVNEVVKYWMLMLKLVLQTRVRLGSLADQLGEIKGN